MKLTELRDKALAISHSFGRNQVLGLVRYEDTADWGLLVGWSTCAINPIMLSRCLTIEEVERLSHCDGFDLTSQPIITPDSRRLIHLPHLSEIRPVHGPAPYPYEHFVLLSTYALDRSVHTGTMWLCTSKQRTFMDPDTENISYLRRQ